MKSTRVIGWTLAVMAVFVILAYLLFSWPIALGLALGSMVMAVNWFFTRRILLRALDSPGTPKMQFLLLLVGKVLLFLALVLLCMKAFSVHILAFGLGIVLTAVLTSFQTAWTQRKE